MFDTIAGGRSARRLTDLQRLLFLCAILLMLTQSIVPALPTLAPPRAAPVAAPAAAATSATAASSATSAAPIAVPNLLSRPELVDRREEFARHYDMGNGQYVAVVGLTPLNYKDTLGRWQPIQPAWQAYANGFQVAHNSLRSTLTLQSSALQVESQGLAIIWRPVALAAAGAGGADSVLASPRGDSTAPAGKLLAGGLIVRYDQGWSDTGLSEEFHSSPGAVEQQLILSRAPQAAGGAEWLAFKASLTVPKGVQFYADGTPQTGSFTTAGDLELRGRDGSVLLTLARPSAYELGRPESAVGGRYQVTITEQGAELAVLTPWSWWANPARQYPAVLDPTMQVLRDSEHANASAVSHDTGSPTNPADYYQSAKITCIGHWVEKDANDDEILGYRRGYMRFPLPSLPSGALQPTHAYVVGVPDGTIVSDPTFKDYDDQTTRQPVSMVEMTTDDWINKLWTPAAPSISGFPSGMLDSWPYFMSPRAILKEVNPAKGQSKNLPAAVWDVTNAAKKWYQDPTTNHGLMMGLVYEGWYHFEDTLDPVPPETEETHPAAMCFPQSPNWANLDNVVAHLSDPNAATTDGMGIGLLVTYSDPQLADESMLSATVPSAIPTQNYRYQFHEYRLPAPIPNRWRIFAAQGAYSGDVYPNTPLDLANGAGDLLVSSAGGAAAPYNASYQWQPNYVAVNGDQGGLALRVQPDNQPQGAHNSKKYYLQTEDAQPSPPINTGAMTSIPISMTRRLVYGQELNLAPNTTVEVKVPYQGTSPAFNQDNAAQLDLQLFAPVQRYVSRTQKGSRVIPGPDGWEIELTVPASYGGRWLLALNSNRGLFTIQHMVVQVTACPNDSNVVRYPLDGQCVELRRPPAGFASDPARYKELGTGSTRWRLYSPGGFSQSGSTWTTKPTDANNIAVMPLLGYGSDDQHWVALKGATYTLDSGTNAISTSPDARLVLADFTQPDRITSLPVLRGAFQATLSSPGVVTVPPGFSPSDLTVLLGSPLAPTDDKEGAGDKNGWRHRIDMNQDRLIATGPVVRTSAPTVNQTATSFAFNATWSVTAAGGPSLQSTTTLASIAVPSGLLPDTFNIGTLFLTAPTPAGSYSEEFAASDADANQPSSIPDFRQIRVKGSVLAQPQNTGGARLPVAAVILPPGVSVKDETGNDVYVQCGADNTYACFDLRGPNDQMLGSGPRVDRTYNMPDLIVQDKANTVMVSSNGHLEVYSTDHPRADPAGVNQTSFSYEAFGATVQTFRGACPQARDPLNPSAHTGPLDGDATVLVGHGGMSMPNAGESAGSGSAAPEIQIDFTLCDGSLREMKFTFDTGTTIAIPIGSSGLWLNHIAGTISLAPKDPNQPGYTTVVLVFGFRGMTPVAAGDQFFMLGAVTIDSRGLFDVQLQAAIQVGVAGVGADGHFWVAWSPLDLGFQVDACLPKTISNGQFPYPDTLCAGNELLYGMLKMHTWQGQGWQHRYPWLPDDSRVHATARFEAKITIGRGLVIDWAFLVIPPVDMPIASIELAFGEFCKNGSCTQYEWGVLGAVGICGYDVGIYYGFDTGIHFFTGSSDYTLIDEKGQQGGSPSAPAELQADAAAGVSSTVQKTVTLTTGLSSAMFALGSSNTTWESKATLTLVDPQGTIISPYGPPQSGITFSNYISETLVAVKNPKPGVWHVTIGNLAQGIKFNFGYFANNPPPVVTFGPLGLTADSNSPVHLTWTSTISSTAARLSIFYRAISAPLVYSQTIEGPIVENLPLTFSGQYDWNLAPLPSGSYGVYARVDTPAAVSANRCAAEPGQKYPHYSADPIANQHCGTMLDKSLVLPVARIDVPGTLRYTDYTVPQPPTGVRARPEGLSNLVVSWLASSKADKTPEVDLAGYVVTCSQTASGVTRQVRVPATVQSGKTISETARVNGLNKEPATCVVQAYDASQHLSAASGPATATPSTNFSVPQPVGSLQAGPVPLSHAASLNWAAAPSSVQGYLLFYYPVATGTAAAAASEGQAQLNGFGLLAQLATGGTDADQGPSPIDVGNVTSFHLTGLADGTSYQAWVVPYDADGRTGPQGPIVTFNVPVVRTIYLPLHRR